MTEFLLLLSLWPFHHKADPSAEGRHAPTWCYGEDGKRESCKPDICSKSGNVWFYTEEGITGIGASCDAAKKDWNSAHIDPVRMSRS